MINIWCECGTVKKVIRSFPDYEKEIAISVFIKQNKENKKSDINYFITYEKNKTTDIYVLYSKKDGDWLLEKAFSHINGADEYIQSKESSLCPIKTLNINNDSWWYTCPQTGINKYKLEKKQLEQ